MNTFEFDLDIYLETALLFIMTLLYSSSFGGQLFYESDLAALTACSISPPRSSTSLLFAICYRGPVLSYFYTYSAVLAFIRYLIGRETFITGGCDQLAISYGQPRDCFLKLLLVFCFIFSRKLLFVSSSDYNLANKFFCKIFAQSCVQDKVLLSRHCIDSCEAAAVTQRCNSRHSRFDILTICWQGHADNVLRKGVDRVIHFYDQLHVSGCESNVLIVGKEGAGTPLIRSLISNCSFPERFVLSGYLPHSELQSLFLSIPCYVQFSRYEGYGMACAQAGLYGCKVISSSVGGLLDSAPAWTSFIDFDSQSESEILSLILGSSKELMPSAEDRALFCQSLSVEARAQSFAKAGIY